MTQSKLFRLSLTLLWPLLLLVLWWGQHTAAAQPPANPNLGYGFNVAEWDRARLEGMGFNWMKVFNAPARPNRSAFSCAWRPTPATWAI
ncbi:MAG: hypothetical protein IPL28_23190 [Chloroflexi bacterium]|nr:hypothetical protein [Chloroflexota bacterium]